MQRPYEWSSSLSYLFQDRVVGGDFTLALDSAVLAMAHETGDQATIAWVLHGATNPLRVQAAVASSLTPHNSGDGRGTVPAPNVEVLKADDAHRGGTVDYMTYNARLATLLCQVAGAVGMPLTQQFHAQLAATWLYLASFFPPARSRRPTPSTRSTGPSTCRASRRPTSRCGARLLDMLHSGSRADYYEPQFLGPVTLTHTP